MKKERLTIEDRMLIENLLKENYKLKDIAAKLGVHRTTIWKELKYRIKSKIMIRSGKIKNKSYNVDDAQYDAVIYYHFLSFIILFLLLSI